MINNYYNESVIGNNANFILTYIKINMTQVVDKLCLKIHLLVLRSFSYRYLMFSFQDIYCTSTSL